MTWLVVSAAVGGPPFRGRRFIFRFAAGETEARAPIYAVADPSSGVDARGLLLIGDVELSNPEVASVAGLAQTYWGMLGALEELAARKCEGAAPVQACRRVRHAAVPWRGVRGGWSFNAKSTDTLYAAVLAAVEEAYAVRPSAVLLLDWWRSGGLSHSAGAAAEAAARLAALLRGGEEVDYTLVDSGAEPEDPREPVHLEEAWSEPLEDWEAGEALLEDIRDLGPGVRVLARPRRPAEPVELKHVREAERHAVRLISGTAVLAAAAMQARAPHLYAYAACAVEGKAAAMLGAARDLLQAYAEATTVRRGKDSVEVEHAVRLQGQVLAATLPLAVAVAAKPPLACSELGAGEGEEETRGIPREKLVEVARRMPIHPSARREAEEAARSLKPDYDESACENPEEALAGNAARITVEEDGKLRIPASCLKKLRRALLEQGLPKF